MFPALAFRCAFVTLLLALAAAARAQAPQDEPRFDILEFVVQGNTVLEAPDIERAVYPFLGPQRVMADVEGARLALEKAYRARGYGTVSVDVPEQRVDGAAIVLQVAEGRVTRVRVTGSRWFSQGYILEKVPEAAEGKVPQFGDLAAQLASVNRTPDRKVTPLLRPGRAPGTTELDLTVEDQRPMHGSVELNNQNSPNTTPARLVASLRYDNLFQRDHSISLQAQLSPQDTREVKVLGASYSVPLGERGIESLTLSATRSDSTVAAGVGSTTVFGKGTIWGLRRSFVVDLREGSFHSITAGADYKDFSETIDSGDSTTIRTPITYLPLTLGWLGVLDGKDGRTQLGGSLVLGLRGLVNRQAEFSDKRFQANASFSLLKADVAREQRFDGGAVLAGRMEGQLTGGPLISNEQFVAGGANSVRGYPESAAVGDIGLRAGLELRSPELARDGWRWLQGTRALAFVEGAALELRDPLPAQQARFRLLGAGFGLRARAGGYGSLSLDIAWALKPIGKTERGDVRVHAAGSMEF